MHRFIFLLGDDTLVIIRNCAHIESLPWQHRKHVWTSESTRVYLLLALSLAGLDIKHGLACQFRMACVRLASGQDVMTEADFAEWWRENFDLRDQQACFLHVLRHHVARLLQLRNFRRLAIICGEQVLPPNSPWNQAESLVVVVRQYPSEEECEEEAWLLLGWIFKPLAFAFMFVFPRTNQQLFPFCGAITIEAGHAPILDFLEAAGNGDAPRVAELLERPLDPNSNVGNRAALHRAAEGGHLEVAHCLLGSEVDIDQTDRRARTPLYVASQGGREDLAQCLLVAAADPEKAERDGRTPLHAAAFFGHLGVVHCLLEAGAVKNAQKNGGGTPLYFAAVNGHIDIVRCLLEACVDKDLADNYGRTPLHMSARHGHGEVVRCLLEAGDDQEQICSGGRSLLHIAAKHGSVEVVRYLLQTGAETAQTDGSGRTPLHCAAQGGNSGVVHCLLQAGADLGKCDSHRHTPIYVACANGHPHVVRILLDAGADKDKGHSRQTRSPLHVCARRGHAEVTRCLLDAGADKDKTDRGGRTPLYLAASQATRKLCVCCLLLVLTRTKHTLGRLLCTLLLSMIT